MSFHMETNGPSEGKVVNVFPKLWKPSVKASIQAEKFPAEKAVSFSSTAPTGKSVTGIATETILAARKDNTTNFDRRKLQRDLGK
jgi:hypothetical protein